MKLKDISKVQSGFAFKSDSFVSNETPIIRIGNIVNNEVVIDDEISAPISIIGERKEFLINKNDILIAMSGATVGKVGIYNYDYPSMLNQRVGNIKADSKYQKYIYYLLQSPLFKKYVELSAFGCAQPNISGAQIENFEFKESTINEIEKIVSELDKITSLINIRKNEIEKCNNLIKSQFVEMFGQPFNSNIWEYRKLGDISDNISDGNNVDTKYYLSDGEILYFRIQNVWRNEFRLDDVVFISKAANEKYQDSSLKYGDILISKIGRYYTVDSSLGRVSVYLGEDDKANYSNNIMAIRLKKNYNSQFVNALLNMDLYQNYIRRESKGGTDKRALSKKIVSEFPIISPPLELQNKYVDFVKRIDKQKFEFEKSLKKLEELQASLMQEYFG